MDAAGNQLQPPAMPVNPRPRDIVMYNAWAMRNGQPLWGAQGEPPAAPAPRRGRPGLPVPAPPAHGQIQQGDVGGNWQRGTYWVNRTEWALTAQGVPRKLRSWNSRTGQYTWFPAGRDYYDHNRQKFLINVPCVGYIHPADTGRAGPVPSMASNMDIDADNAPDVPLIRMSVWGEGNFTRTIPLQPDGFNDAL